MARKGDRIARPPRRLRGNQISHRPKQGQIPRQGRPRRQQQPALGIRRWDDRRQEQNRRHIGNQIGQ